MTSGSWFRAAALGALLAVCASAGPLEFGRAELNASLAARGMNPAKLRVITEVSVDPPESFRIERGRIFGGDLRGLMYGLLEAADQIRVAGKLSNTRAQPAMPIRGVRVFAGKEHTNDDWRAFIQMLARNRFNRFNLAGDLNLERVRFISQTASDHGIDFTLGISQPDVAALKDVLRTCPAIRSVQMRAETEHQEEVYRAIQDSGRLVKLDVRGRLISPALLHAAKTAGVPLRVSATSDSYLNLLEREPKSLQPEAETPLPMINGLPKPAGLSRPYEFYWEVGGSESQGQLPWGDPDSVRRAVSTFTVSDTQGFEIEPPVAEEGLGFKRYSLFYMLWGRLSYDPNAPDRVWMHELQKRFGTAAGEVLNAHKHSNRYIASLMAPVSNQTGARRPSIEHSAPQVFEIGKPLTLSLRIASSERAQVVRLHYRAVNQLDKFRTMEADPRNAVFTIAAENLPARFDLMYYFEVHNRDHDPAAATPYYVVTAVKP